MASGALPPGFPRVEIDGEHLLGRRPRLEHAAAMGAGIRSAPGYAGFPGRPLERAGRGAARPRRGRDRARRTSGIRAARAPTPTSSAAAAACASALRKPAARAAAGAAWTASGRRLLRSEADGEGLQHRAPDLPRRSHYEGTQGLRVLAPDHGGALGGGYHDAVRTLRHPEALERPRTLDGVATFDLAQASASDVSRHTHHERQAMTMKIAMCAPSAFAMPLTSPAYPKRALPLRQSRILDHHLSHRSRRSCARWCPSRSR